MLAIPSITKKNLLILYLGLGPVFWIGPLELKWFKLFKLILFVILLGFTFYEDYNNKEFKYNKTFLSFVIFLFITSLFGFLQTNVKGIINVSFSYILILLVSWVFYSYFKDKTLSEIEEIFYKSTKIIGFLCGFIVFNHFVPIVDWKHISEITESYSSYVKLADTGFSTGRTAWSNSLALYSTIALYLFFKYKKFNYFLLVLVIITTQVLSGGRGGLLISLLVLLLNLILTLNIKLLLFIAIVTSFTISYNQEYFKKRFRIDRLEKVNTKKDENLNKFTAGRLEHFSFAFDAISKDFNYLKGNGFFNENNKIRGKTEIHFLWLKKLLEGGFIYLSVYIIFVLLFLTRLVNLVIKDKNHKLYLIIFLAGLLTTLFEPNAIFGSLQSSLIWWASLAAAESIRVNSLC